MSFDPINSPRPNSEPDPYPDLPLLPDLSFGEICNQLQDTIGDALDVVCQVRGLTKNDLVEQISSLLGISAEATEAHLASLLQGWEPITPAIVSQFSKVFNVRERDIYRAALLLKQQEGLTERENLENLEWDLRRKL
jgi:hypothetical protein